jgi:integrase
VRASAGSCAPQGIDPIAHHSASVAQQRASDAKSLTFREAAERYIASHEAGWTPKHHRAWTDTLRDYAHPVLGDLPVRMIDTPLVMQVLAPAWKTRTETASRLRGRIEMILDWAKVSGFRDGENPARWRGHLNHLLPRRTKVRAIVHYRALPYAEIGAFMSRLRANDSITAQCLVFIILTAARLSEGRLATWGEIDFESKTWTLSAARMKARKQHKVPLSSLAIELLKEMRAICRGDFIFHGMREGQPVSQTMVLMLTRQCAGTRVSVHGFRSTFRDWAAEQTSFPREVAEMALAHGVGSDVERAYRRGDLFEKRGQLMESWARHCGNPATGGTVVAIGRRGDG